MPHVIFLAIFSFILYVKNLAFFFFFNLLLFFVVAVPLLRCDMWCIKKENKSHVNLTELFTKKWLPSFIHRYTLLIPFCSTYFFVRWSCKFSRFEKNKHFWYLYKIVDVSGLPSEYVLNTLNDFFLYFYFLVWNVSGWLWKTFQILCLWLYQWTNFSVSRST